MSNLKLFISHASEDKQDIAKPLCDGLKNNGFQVWYDNDDIHIGNSIKQSIVYGLAKYDVFIMIISPNYFKKNWTNFEFGCISNLGVSTNKKIIPIFYNVNREEIIKTYSFLGDIKSIAYDGSIDNIVKLLSEEFTQPPSGFFDLKKYNLIDIIKFYERTNKHELLEISNLLNQWIEISLIDEDMSIIKAGKILLHILKNIEISEKTTLLTEEGECLKVKNNGIINQNIQQYFDYIFMICNELIFDFRNKYFLSISKNKVEAIESYMVNILNWYYNTFFSQEIPIEKNKNLKIVESQNFLYDDFVTAYEIEKEALPLNMISPPDTVWNWYQHNNYIMHGIRDMETKKIVAFINAIPISKKLFEKICRGKYIDVDLSVEEIREYDIPDFYYLYLCSFCVSKSYQNSTAFTILYNSFIDFLLNLTKKEIFIKETVADAVTERGVKLCEHIGMKKIAKSNHNSGIYTANFIPPNISLKNLKGKELISYYKGKYEEFKEISNY